MVKVKARLKLYDGKEVRQTPFLTGYRPLFNFIPKTKASGHIILLDRNSFFPGDEAIVEIKFINSSCLGDSFQKGTKATFDEGRIALGEVEILEILKE